MTEMVSSERVLRWIGRLARFVYARAAAITVISPGFKRHLADLGIPREEIHVIPNWADEEIYRPVPADPALAQRWGLDGRFNIIYAGNIGPAQALATVLDAAAELQDLPDVQFVLIGDGIDRVELERQVQARRLHNVRFLPHQPAERMPYFFALAHVLLIHLKRDPLYEITIPSKTLAYLACGRPILCAVAGDVADVVWQARAGVICPPQAVAGMVTAVRQMYAMPAAEREAMGAAGRRAFLTYYSRRVLVDQYEALMQAVAGRGKAKSRVQNSGGAQA